MSGAESRELTDFFTEIMDHQITAREFFCSELLQSLCRYFGYRNAVIFYFDTEGNFLSWRDMDSLHLSNPDDPYTTFKPSDIVRHTIHRDAMRDRLTYFNTEPRVYRSTDICTCMYYGNSAYAHFVEQAFGGYYSATLAFGINAYIQVSFFKTREEGDFSNEEMKQLSQLYVCIANSYKTFKKYEQARIVSEVQGDVIGSGERAFLITDVTLHLLSYNRVVKDYLIDLLGPSVAGDLRNGEACHWLSLILNVASGPNADGVRETVMRGYTFRIHDYDRSYSNGIIDKYYWITISKAGESPSAASEAVTELLEPTSSDEEISRLTPAEQRVAQLMYRGMTYQEIADELVISFHTVKKHVQNIYNKCGINSRYQLYKWIEEHQVEK